jgi:hypothetical protein
MIGAGRAIGTDALGAALIVFLVFSARSAAAQVSSHAIGTEQHFWATAGVGGATLGVAPEVSLWYGYGPFVVGGRWTKTVKWGEGTGEEHELSALAGGRVPVGRAGLVLAGGLANAAGCLSRGESSTCTPLGSEWDPAWGADLEIPFGKSFGVDAVGFGVRGTRVRYGGFALGVAIGKLR